MRAVFVIFWHEAAGVYEARLGKRLATYRQLEVLKTPSNYSLRYIRVYVMGINPQTPKVHFVQVLIS